LGRKLEKTLLVVLTPNVDGVMDQW